MKSLDTEDTGIDLYHNAKPFLVTICKHAKGGPNQNLYWECDVDPLTREPQWTDEDLDEIKAEVESGEELALQNPVFDVTALATLPLDIEWPWNKTYDTLLGGHLLGSNLPHDLTSMLMMYLGVNIEKYEQIIKKSTEEARKIARKEHKDWLIAKKGLAGMPSAKGEQKKDKASGLPGSSPWKFDMWLPRTIARIHKYSKSHPWWTDCANYANADSAGTLPLMEHMIEKIKERDLWEIYLESLKILWPVHSMQRRGLSYSGARLQEIQKDYREQSRIHTEICHEIADSYNTKVELPKSGVNNSLKTFLFDHLKLKPHMKINKKTKKESLCLDKKVMQNYIDTLPIRSKQSCFISSLVTRRRYNTSIQYTEGYERYALPVFQKWIPVKIVNAKTGAGWYILHPSLNPTGTNTLRFSSKNPNKQNVSKQKISKESRTLRYLFGPLPGREWWSCDAKNIELRLPAYEAGEQAMIDLFERPNEAPYFGSYHLLVFDILHPAMFKEHGAACKDVYEDTWYQWVKNGNFAVQYGAQEYSGTADAAYHVKGAQARIQGRFTAIKELSDSMIAHAEAHGFVYTMSDKTVNPNHGYPINCTRTAWGQIKPTVPLSYHIQGSAMWWMRKAMIRCQAQVDKWNRDSYEKDMIYLIAQVHDELLFDFPRGKGDEPWLTHRDKMKKIQTFMSMGGDDMGVPTPVSCGYHSDNWSEKIAL